MQEKIQPGPEVVSFSLPARKIHGVLPGGAKQWEQAVENTRGSPFVVSSLCRHARHSALPLLVSQACIMLIDPPRQMPSYRSHNSGFFSVQRKIIPPKISMPLSSARFLHAAFLIPSPSSLIMRHIHHSPILDTSSEHLPFPLTLPILQGTLTFFHAQRFA